MRMRSLFPGMFAVRDWRWGVAGGLACLAGGLAFVVWPLFMLSLLGSIVGFQLLFAGGTLLSDSYELKQLEDAGARVRRVEPAAHAYEEPAFGGFGWREPARTRVRVVRY